MKKALGIDVGGTKISYAIINENGEFVSPNEIIAILLKYLKNKGLNGAVVKTVGSSILIDNVAKFLDVDVIETSVGFKHVGKAMRLNEVIIGGEESGGLSIKGHIPEKDGLVANLLLLEAMAVTGKSLVELQEEIHKLGGKYYTDRIDLKKTEAKEIKLILDKFRNATSIGEYSISNIDLKDGIKLMLGSNIKILARPSGTEPLLRIYFEADSLEVIEKLKEDVKIFI